MSAASHPAVAVTATHSRTLLAGVVYLAIVLMASPPLSQAGPFAPLSASFNKPTQCMPCPVGSFAEKEPSDNCYIMDINHTCINGTCPVPPAGYHGPGYQPPGGNITLCTRCPVNQYQDEPGQASCKNCTEGHQPDTNRTGCVTCNDGEVSNSTTGFQCVSCYQLHFGFHSAPDHTKCIACSPGNMSWDAIRCTACSEGFYWNTTTKICSQPCPPGRFCTSSDTNPPYCKTCDPCDKGHFQDRPGSYNCKPCPAGFSQDLPGRPSCNPCAAGRYQPDTAQPQCLPCSPGTFQDQQGKVSCKPCRSGQVQFEPGQPTCEACEAGFYCPNGTSQIPCPEGKYCPSGSSHPSTCPSLYVGTAKACVPSGELYAIISCTCIGCLAIIGLIIYQRVRNNRRQRVAERRRLLTEQQSKQPVYTGL